MDENRKNRKSKSPFLGNGFLRIPRRTLGLLFDGTVGKRMLGQVYLCVAFRAYHTEGNVTISGKDYRCRRGEYVGSQEALSQMVGLSGTMFRKYVSRLCEMGLLEMESLHRGSRIRVVHYDYLSGYYAVSPSVLASAGTESGCSLSEAESQWMQGGRSLELDEQRFSEEGGRV